MKKVKRGKLLTMIIKHFSIVRFIVGIISMENVRQVVAPIVSSVS
jgi:hypothetical protein